MELIHIYVTRLSQRRRKQSDIGREVPSHFFLELKLKNFYIQWGKNKQMIYESIQMNETLWNSVQSQFTP